MRDTDKIIREILATRGITSETDVEEFLSPTPKLTHDPFLLADMQEGVDLILSEINRGTGVCIYGDYDADGVTSVCILSNVLKELTSDLTYYIPSRFTEGYGLNCAAIDKIHENGAGLLITVDCGSVSYDEVEYAKSLGMKVVVTDHHNLEKKLADCPLINPKRRVNQDDSDSPTIYPFSGLAGCGVAFKLAQAIQRTAGLPKDTINSVLDLVAIGTIGDIVSLTDENRTLVKYGMHIIGRGERKALTDLANAISLEKISSENIAFGIVPHINAAGRMASATEAAELFLADSEDEINEKVNSLVRYNRDRKSLQEEAYQTGLDMVSGDENFMILRMDNIHEGIGGIAAGKLKDKFTRPVIIVTPAEDGRLKGTGRSIPGVDLFGLLNRHSELFIRFGGHMAACGFLIEEANYPELCRCLNDDVAELIKENPDLFLREMKYDISLDPDEMNVDLARELLKLEPFGEGNPAPKFLVENVVLSNVQYMGDSGQHARFTIGRGGVWANGVMFRTAGEMSDLLESGKPLSMTGSLNYQVWRGREKAQFIVEDIHEQ